jgi:hypothetical protein
VHGGAGVDLVGEAGEQGQRGGGLRDQAQGAGGGHRERALGADQQAGEVVAGDALDRAVTDAQWFTGAGDDVEAEHEVAGDAVLARPRAAGVGRDVAAEAALLPARRVGRVEQAAGLGRGLQAALITPGSTSASSERSSMSRMRSRPARSSTTPPWSARQPPTVPVPAPRGLSGTPSSWHSATSSATWARSRGRTTRPGGNGPSAPSSRA